MSLLEVRGFDAGYDELEVVHGVDLAVGDGEYVTIIGPNGAGKSTLLRGLFDLADRQDGTITFDGQDLSSASTVEVVTSGMGLTPQESNVFPDLTVEENLTMGAYTRGDLPQSVLDRIYERFSILERRTDQLAGELSGGQRQMLAISRALITDPELLVLDEPSAGLAPDLVQDLFDEIDAINDNGTAILIVEQNAEEILRRADRAYVLTQGRIRREAPADELLDDEPVRAVSMVRGSMTRKVTASDGVDRRTFLKTSGAAGVAGVTGLAGCTGGGGGDSITFGQPALLSGDLHSIQPPVSASTDRGQSANSTVVPS